ncbi:hypothetical protein DL93DRAFT_420228 [Clavulina sp. PMI_390]|nr:hypothetical protein DL93DRAFT_420228 [Clavulina sp. PMI_390]
MRAATSVALIALLAAPAFAAPISSTPAEEEPSFGTQIISSAAGGAASGAVGNLLSEIESFFKRGLDERSTGALTNIVKQAQTLSAADKATVKTALVNKISTLQTPSKRLSIGDAAGKALDGLANEGAKTAVGGLLSDIENLFRREDGELEARAPLSATSLGGSLVSSAAGGAASGLVGNLLGEIESLFRRESIALEVQEEEPSLVPEIVTANGGTVPISSGNILQSIEGLSKRSTGALTNIIKQAQTLSAADKATVKTALINKIGTLQTPSKRLSVGDAAGKALGGLANEGAKTAVGGLLTDIENLFRRNDAELEARAPLSATSLGGSLVSSAAGGAASGLVGNLLSEIESFFKRDVGLIFPDGSIPIIPVIREGVPLAARAPLSSTSLGGSLLSSAAGGAASGLVGNLLGEIESLFRRGITDVHDEDLYVKRDASSITSIIKQAQTLSASDKATVKTALVNKIGTLQGKRSLVSEAVQGHGIQTSGQLEILGRSPLSSTSLGGSLLSSAAGGAASGLVGNLLGEIESLFRRDVAEGHDEGLYAKRGTSSISNIIKQAQTLSASDKATVKTALMNKIGTLQGKRDITSTSTGTGSSILAPNPAFNTPETVLPGSNLTPEQLASLLGLARRSEEFE